MRRDLPAGVAMFVWLVAAPAVAQDRPQGEPMAVESTALVPLDTESAMAIVGIEGQILVSGGTARELRVVSRSASRHDEEIPVGIWQEGSRLVVAPPEGAPAGPRLLHVEIPENIALAIDAANSDVIISAIGGSVDLTGTNLKAQVRSSKSGIQADVTGGSLTIADSEGASVRARGTNVRIFEMRGPITVRANGGEVRLSSVRASSDVESEGSTVTVEVASGPLRVKAHEGTVAAKGLGAGGDFELTAAPLKLEECKGELNVTSDGSVEFLSMSATMHLDLYGGNLRGKKNDGILEVRTRNTEVNVESIDQGMRIQGDGLKARIVDVGGELYVETSVSELFVDRATNVDMRLDRGNLTLMRAAGTVSVVMTGGDVQILDGVGPIQLDLDGGDADVSWASLPSDKDSKIVNKSGQVMIRLPVAGACRIEAKSRSGRVESDLPTVRVLGSGDEAQGPVNGGSRPVIRVEASRDVVLTGGASPPPADE